MEGSSLPYRMLKRSDAFPAFRKFLKAPDVLRGGETFHSSGKLVNLSSGDN